jgi:hypothetical protein
VTARSGLMLSAVLLLACAALIYVVPRRRAQRVVGSNTNATEIVDLPFIAPDASPEEVLDVAVEYTFPASDPIAIEDAYRIRLGSEQH